MPRCYARPSWPREESNLRGEFPWNRRIAGQTTWRVAPAGASEGVPAVTAFSPTRVSAEWPMTRTAARPAVVLSPSNPSPRRRVMPKYKYTIVFDADDDEEAADII